LFESLTQQGLAPFLHLALDLLRAITLGSIGEIQVFFQIPLEFGSIRGGERIRERQGAGGAGERAARLPRNLDSAVFRVVDAKQMGH